MALFIKEGLPQSERLSHANFWVQKMIANFPCLYNVFSCMWMFMKAIKRRSGLMPRSWRAAHDHTDLILAISSMKKALVLLVLLVFFWAQSAAVAHVYSPACHVGTCPQCTHLNQCSAADLQPIVELPSFDLQEFFTPEKSAQVVSQPQVYFYSSRSPPITLV